MFKVLDKKLILIPFAIMLLHIVILCTFILVNNFSFGILSFFVSTIILILVYIYANRWLSLSENNLQLLAKDIATGKQYTVDDLPFGLIILNDDDEIMWMNEYMESVVPEELYKEPINVTFPNLLTTLRTNNLTSTEAVYNDRYYSVYHEEDIKALHFVDITKLKELENKIENARPVIGILFLDNYDDVTQNMTEALKSELNNMITTAINEWATEHHIYIRRFSNDRFMIVMNTESLKSLEKTKFELLDTVRDNTQEIGAQITLSIGIGEGSADYTEVGQLAQSALDLSLGRGGDQVAIKAVNGAARFYGGKTDPMEKRTRVKARVMAHALRDILKEGDNVIIMGHKSPDVDSIGASIGVAKIASSNDIDAKIVLNESDLDDTLSRLMNEVRDHESLYNLFISSDDAWDIMTPNTTVVVVDTHRPSMVLDEDILNKATRKVVIDHHRRADEMISNPLLVYMEPYASSACELVAELLEYQYKQNKMSRIEATVMLTGIIVDTRNYTLRTGSRTFDAASYLRSNGADPVLAQKFLKDDIDTFIARSDLIKSANIDKHGIAIVKADPTMTYHPVTVAQAADTLLQMEGVRASFVVAIREDESIGISARSLGEVNVQIIMEALGGGGHLTNAATRRTDLTIDELYDELVTEIENARDSRSEDE
ncbi:DHH family phosphoesterase [Phocicoccus pinnipedialis]|uniref:Cyclic-di-AMP phosphodiesterase n=1 Tax=Phocicoccus pinnipedialis TaxID=110845 RepID=A0A6V7R4V4_9BACL|nr:DHH family phosphoesterase [Jeotgalicoccus pinnipedialis]MBP1939734.1 c-di-AMP phosphodiesterase-like protein [Jeotgalicoccus pinnipedialis]CAD2072356.1 Bifunctional oligoribonuclease and PAP phosphatase NrnA [Jeotgalicoccus pinnipedialis]